MKVTLLIAIVISLVISAVIGGRPRPAFVSYSGCRPKSGSTYKGCKCTTNTGIQIGETWANTRVQGQLSGFFISYKPGEKNYDSEGGPYGDGTGCDCYPTNAEMVKSENLADFCFFWKPADNTGKGGKSGKGGKNKGKGTNSTNSMPTVIPGEEVIPPCLVCPHNLNPCYSANYFEKGGPLAGYASQRPTYKGPWFPPKDPKSKKPLFCQGFNLGCPAPTYRDLQLHRLPGVNCDVSKCERPTTTG